MWSCIGRFLVLGALLTPAVAHAQPGPTFYQGKEIKVVVGYAAGGGYDTYARVVASHLGKHIPGNPTLIVQNMRCRRARRCEFHGSDRASRWVGDSRHQSELTRRLAFGACGKVKRSVRSKAVHVARELEFRRFYFGCPR